MNPNYPKIKRVMNIDRQIIDDDQEILNFFKKISNEISQARFDLITSKISDLISHLESTQEVDLVIIDVNMPQNNGFDVAEYINIHYPFTSIIFMSYLRIMR